MVINPSRGLSIGGRSTVRRAAKKNPVKRTAAPAAKVNPKRRRRRRNPASPMLRRNPSSITGLVVSAVMTAGSVTVLDLLATRVFPQNSLIARVGVKLGLAAVFQSSLGAKVPVAGKYKNEIALVFAVLGFADLFKAYVLPPVNQVISNVTGGAFSLVPAAASAPALAAAPAGTLGNIYGNSRRRSAYGGLQGVF